jgi:hypothetical protein
MTGRVGGAIAVSLAAHGLVVGVVLRTRLSRPLPARVEEPLQVELATPEPPAAVAPGAAPAEATAKPSLRTRPLGVSSLPPPPPTTPPPSAPAAPSVGPTPPRPPPAASTGPIPDLSYHARFGSSVAAPAVRLHPAFDPQAFPARAEDPMESPDATIESVLEFKRAHERPTAVPEAYRKLQADEAAPAPDYSIAHHRDGSAVYRDARAHRFDATIAADGTVSFDDHHVHVRNPAEQLRRWVDDPIHNLPPMPELIIDIDLTDELMRALGQDPYAPIKRKLLADTLALRQRRADAHRRETLVAAMTGLRPFLRALCADPRRSAAEKRALLRDLADEADLETPAGRRAREIILEVLGQLGSR